MAAVHRWSIAALVSLGVVCALVTLENLAAARFVTHLPRFPADVSATYLRRELRDIAASPPQVLFFGDSVLWGYRLPAEATAVSILSSFCTEMSRMENAAPSKLPRKPTRASAADRGIRPTKPDGHCLQSTFSRIRFYRLLSG